MLGHLVVGAAASLLGKPLVARVATDWAERELPAWEAKRPGDRMPREAIAAARAWADCPCEDHRADAEAAAYDATLPEGAGGSACYAVAYACGGQPNLVAADAAKSAADTATDPDAERQWQRLRLAAYVLGEVE